MLRAVSSTECTWCRVPLLYCPTRLQGKGKSQVPASCSQPTPFRRRTSGNCNAPSCLPCSESHRSASPAASTTSLSKLDFDADQLEYVASRGFLAGNTAARGLLADLQKLRAYFVTKKWTDKHVRSSFYLLLRSVT